MLWFVPLAALSCDVDDSRGKLQSCIAENGSLQGQNGDLQHQTSQLQAELADLRRRKDVVYTVKMVVDFSDLQGPAAQAGAPAMTFLTEARLVSSAGTTYRLLGHSSPSSPTQGAPELLFEPIDASQWTALQISALSQLQTLTLDFPATFNAAGVAWGEEPRLDVHFQVNGIEVVDFKAAIDLAAAKAGQPFTWNVQKAFDQVSAEYTRQLDQRARAS